MERDAGAGLARVLGLGGLVAYGVGDILGAGIYALVGEVAALAGPRAWLAFVVAIGVAALTALSYSELGARFPRSAGEAHFAWQAFRRDRFALFIGWLVLASGVVSMATIAWAFAGYARDFAPAIPERVALLGFLVALAGIAFWGMRQSSVTNVACTFVEATGLLLVIAVGIGFLLGGEAEPPPPPPTVDAETWGPVLRGGALAFFAFIGFEDLVNVAEEVREPERHLPVALLASLAAAGLIYVAVSYVAVRVVGAEQLAASPAPLLEVVRIAAPIVPDWTFGVVALFALANTALLNFLMGSRLLYGLASQGLLPARLGSVHPTRRTPHVAIGTVLVVGGGLAVSGTLVSLAGATSALVLGVFCVVNLSLVVIRLRDAPPSGFRVPLAVPVLGVFASLGLAAFVPPRSLVMAAAVAALGAALVALRGRLERGDE